jgi:HK97 family phage prohead protease/HK97 family phage major capsid protein
MPLDLSRNSEGDVRTQVVKAWSRLTIKSVDEEMRVIEGIATTPTTDRAGDIVEPKGAVFDTPVDIPLLWQHDREQPIGRVFSASVSDAGISIKARIAKDVLPFIDDAWALIKSGLVRGLSIGFQPVEFAFLKETDGVHFTKWNWLELSAVTIPANTDASIQAIKSSDQALQRAVSGNDAARGVVRIAVTPGAPGSSPRPAIPPTPTLSGVPKVKTITEQVTAFEAKRQATEIMNKAGDEGRTLEKAEKEEHDTLTDELKEVDEHLVRLRDREKSAIASAKPVPRFDVTGNSDDPADAGTNARSGGAKGLQTIFARDSVPKELAYVLHVKCEILARLENNGSTPLDIAKSYYPDMQQLHNVLQAEKGMGTTMQKAFINHMIMKANVTGMNVGDAAGGGALAQYQLYSGDFVEWLRPQTIVGKFGTGNVPALRKVPFMVSIAGQTSGGSGYWVGEGKPKPLTSFGFARTTLAMTKVANIAVVTEEQLRASTPSADMLLRDALSGALIERIDRDFIDPDAAGTANVQPASITYGATTAAASGVINSAVVTDLQTLYSPVLGNNINPAGLVLIMSARTALALSMAIDSLGRQVFPDISMQGGTLKGIPVIVSQYADFGGGNSPASNGVIVLVSAPDIWLADDGAISIAVSNQASLQMLDNPTNDSVTPTPTTMVSMFQTDSVALRAERFINWARRRTGVVSYLTNVAYNGLAS